MSSEHEKIGTLRARSFVVPESRIFAHPTRLMSAWKPEILEIVRRGHTLTRPEINIETRFTSSKVLGIRTRNPAKRLYKNLASPITYKSHPLLDARYEADGNISHLLTSVFAKLLGFQKFGQKGGIILRKNASSLSRKVFTALDVPFICTDRFVVGNLITTDDKVEGALEGWFPDLFREVRFVGEVAGTPKRVFLARRGQRRLLNEPQIETFLAQYGFVKIYFEDIPIGEQWSSFRNADAVVAIHGAGMSALLFCRPNTKVVELFHPGFVNDIFRHITAVMGGAWCGVTGKITKSTVAKLDYTGNPHAVAMDSFEVDKTALKSALDFLNVA